MEAQIWDHEQPSCKVELIMTLQEAELLVTILDKYDRTETFKQLSNKVDWFVRQYNPIGTDNG